MRPSARDDLHVIVHQCQKGVEVAPVEGVNGSVSQLHVLLRHRPRSIPQVGMVGRKWDGRRCGRSRSFHRREAGRCTSALAESGRAAGSDSRRLQSVFKLRQVMQSTTTAACGASSRSAPGPGPGPPTPGPGPTPSTRTGARPSNAGTRAYPSTRTGARPSNARTRAWPSCDSACCEHSQSSSWSWLVTVIAECLRRPPRPHAPAQPPRPREGRSRPDRAGL